MFGSKDLLFSSEKYGVAKSLRFRSGSTTYFNRTFGTPTNQNTWTLSWWMKIGKLGTSVDIFSAGTTNRLEITYSSTGSLNISDASTDFINTNNLLRDPSAWYHCVVKANGTGAALQVYVNGVLTSNSTSNNLTTSYWNASGVVHYIGALGGYSSKYFDGYLAEVNFIDGQALTPSSFGFYDNNGIWQPKGYTGTYGTNGFYLKFTDVGATSGANSGYGKDFSGFNTNYWTTNNFGTTSTATTYDSMYDSPVNASNGITGIGNYAVLNPLFTASAGITLSNANLSMVGASASGYASPASMLLTSGKWYFEVNVGTIAARYPVIGVQTELTTFLSSGFPGSFTANGFGYGADGNKYVNNGAGAAFGSTFASGDVICVAIDIDNGKSWYGKQTGGTGSIAWQASGDPVAGTNSAYTITGGTTLYPCIGTYNAAGTHSVNFGQRPFSATPPSGFSALNTQNLSTPTITNGAAYMAAVTYQGATAPNTVTTSSTNSGNNPLGIAFQPDLVWIKSRSAATDNKLTDAIRGTTKALISNTTGAETTDTNGLTAFTASGFTVGSDTTYNNTTGPATYVAWEWKANGAGSTGSGSGLTSITNSANASAGFSITTYTGNGSAGAYFNHGLSAAPGLVIIKQRTASTTTNWAVWHSSIANTNYLLLNTTAASTSGTTYWNSTTPDSAKVTLGTAADVNTNTGTYVAYCWAPIAGFSAMGSYTGNGNADGPFIYTGFRSRWILFKRTDVTNDWFIYDTSRNTYNAIYSYLLPDSSAAEAGTAGSNDIDVTANGFKIRNTNNYDNANGGTIIYAAFAENPFKIARAR